MLDSSIRRYFSNPLMPLFPGSKQMTVNLAANTYFARGRVLGQLTGSANDVQTLAMTGIPTGGSVTLRVYHPFSMASGLVTIPYNATNTVAQGLIQAVLGAGNVTVTGGALPATPLVFTYSGQFVQMPVALAVFESKQLTGGTAPNATMVHTTIGRSAGTWAPYLSGNADGSQVARAINMYECATDSGGNVTGGPVAIEGNNGVITPDAIVHISGAFDTKELVGFDATAQAALGYLKSGTVADGIFVLPGW